MRKIEEVVVNKKIEIEIEEIEAWGFLIVFFFVFGGRVACRVMLL